MQTTFFKKLMNILNRERLCEGDIDKKVDDIF